MNDILFYTLAFLAAFAMFAIVIFYDPKPNNHTKE